MLAPFRSRERVRFAGQRGQGRGDLGSVARTYVDVTLTLSSLPSVWPA